MARVGNGTGRPGGHVTFLFTDIEGSTQLVQRLGRPYAALLEQHHHLLRAAFERHGGDVFGTEGDAFFVTFPDVPAAIRGAIDAQLLLATHQWPETADVRVRMGIHTGEAHLEATGWVGLAVHEAARVASAAHGGQVLVSDDARQAASVDLQADVDFEDLGEHRLKDLPAPVRLHQLGCPGLRSEFPPPRSQGSAAHNLPTPTTTFIGRRAEIAEIEALLRRTRLLTITGAGGAGKSRLALRAASETLRVYPGGVWLVELAPLIDGSRVMAAVAEALRVPEDPTRTPDDGIAARIGKRRTLLVLDNCEHLVADSAAAVEVLLALSPSLSVLATSREPLGVSGETTWRLPSLGVPADDYLGATEPCEGVQLFCERAVAVDPHFALTPANADAVATIVRQLDGIPLALELAAARLRSLSAEQIVSRLDHRFRLLTGGPRGALPRHQTLAATVDWSYDLLTDSERGLLRRLAVCSGGFTLEAAEALGGDGGRGAEVLDLLDQLVAKSLVIVDQGRYTLLETIRQYALDRLTAAEEVLAARDLHLRWVLALAERGRAELFSERDLACRSAILREHANVRAAVAWAFESGRPAAVLDIGGSLWMAWVGGLTQTEGLDWLTSALEATREDRPPARAPALVAAVLLTHSLGRRAHGLVDEAIAACDALPPGAVRARYFPFALTSRIYELVLQMDVDAARVAGREALAMGRELGDDYGVGLPLLQFGRLTAELDDVDEGTAYIEEAVAMARKSGAVLGEARALYYLMYALRDAGDDERLEHTAQRALTMARDLADGTLVAESLRWLSTVAKRRDDLARACAYGEEALVLARDVGARYLVLHLLRQLASMYRTRGDLVAARSRAEEAAEAERLQ